MLQDRAGEFPSPRRPHPEPVSAVLRGLLALRACPMLREPRGCQGAARRSCLQKLPPGVRRRSSSASYPPGRHGASPLDQAPVAVTSGTRRRANLPTPTHTTHFPTPASWGRLASSALASSHRLLRGSALLQTPGARSAAVHGSASGGRAGSTIWD